MSFVIGEIGALEMYNFPYNSCKVNYKFYYLTLNS